jgi:hypothetical protein
MSKAEAEAALAADIKTLQKLESVDSLSAPAYWPHIGGKCGRCKAEGRSNGR